MKLEAGRFYLSRDGETWCCWRVRDNAFAEKHASAECIRVSDGRSEYFYLDGRYDSAGKREHTLVEESPRRERAQKLGTTAEVPRPDWEATENDVLKAQADEALHLLHAARGILGCEDPMTNIVADAECVRQLAINYRGALSRMVEATDERVMAVRREEARGVLAGQPYDPADCAGPADEKRWREEFEKEGIRVVETGKCKTDGCERAPIDMTGYCGEHPSEEPSADSSCAGQHADCAICDVIRRGEP